MTKSFSFWRVANHTITLEKWKSLLRILCLAHNS